MSGSVNCLMAGGSGGTGAYSASVSTNTLSGQLYDPPGTAITSGAVICTPANGVSPYTYLWEYVSGSTQILPTSGTISNTYFQTYFGGRVGGFRTAIYRCKVTDNLGSIIYSPDVQIDLDAGNL